MHELTIEMNRSAKTCQLIISDIETLNSKKIIVKSDLNCLICKNTLVKTLSFVFPCKHAFHARCLENEVEYI